MACGVGGRVVEPVFFDLSANFLANSALLGVVPVVAVVMVHGVFSRRGENVLFKILFVYVMR